MDVSGRNNNEKKKKETVVRSVSKQVILGLLTNFSSLAPSMSLGFSAVAIPVLRGSLTLNQISWFASIASLATPFGCFLTGPLADRLGRTKALLFVNAASFLGWIILALAFYWSNNYPLLITGRILTGFSTGLSSAPATIYMAEVSSLELRGVFTTWASISFALGVLIIYFLAYILKDAMNLICLITACLPCLGALFTIFLIPESPSWLVGKNRIEEASDNICKVFGTTMYSQEVQNELETLIKLKSVKLDTEKKSLAVQFVRKLKYLFSSRTLKPMALVVTLFFFQQLSGTFVLLFYAIDIVKTAGITFEPYFTIVLIGVIRLISSVLTSIICKKVGRRPLSLLSGMGMTICLLSLSAYNVFQEKGAIPQIPTLPLVLFIAYFVCNALGFLPVPFALAAELFPTKIRGTATGFISGLGYMFNFVIVKEYPDMVSAFTGKGVICFYGVIALVGTIFVALLLPETRGKSQREIEILFGHKASINDAELEDKIAEGERQDLIREDGPRYV
ncbi:unnamed protein product [Callosobruchus maculatus]|uniref:Major facilitator superfamily (MFS) profile domain-containing protein n=2 Tax=Callosobruchus maculatus TaxID=64391 RepID=A0A653CH42_CALMS|nr:unnamed protein product [Callosobruchus maculatus]